MKSSEEDIGNPTEKMEVSLSPHDAKSAKLKDERGKKAYRRAVNYCSRYVSWDPSKPTDKGSQLITMNLKFNRKFERKETADKQETDVLSSRKRGIHQIIADMRPHRLSQ